MGIIQKSLADVKEQALQKLEIYAKTFAIMKSSNCKHLCEHTMYRLFSWTHFLSITAVSTVK